MGGILSWAMRDMFLLIICILILIVNPPEEDSEDKLEISAQGQLIFDIGWENGDNADIDLWVQPPSPEHYVSYQHKGSRSCNLLRDDVGTVKDKNSEWYDPANQEITVCRNPAADREWVANVHYFGSGMADDGRYISVVVSWRLLMHTGSAIVEQDRGRVTLQTKGDEKTLIRFRIDPDGDMYGVSYEYKSLFVQTTSDRRFNGPH